MPNRKRLIVIAGSVAQRPARGGHAWMFLQYMLGFRRLGWDVLFLDRLAADMASGDDEGSRVPSWERNVNWFLHVMRRGRVADGYSLSLPDGTTVGLSREEVLRQAREAVCLLDVNGFLCDQEIGAATATHVFLDIDPGFNQMWHELGLANVLDGYDAYVTIAQRMGQPDCLIPTCGRSWITTLPPVVLEEWPVAPPDPSAAFTSVVSWRGPFAPVEYRGTRYGLRVHEFRRLASTAANSHDRFELVLDIDEADRADAELLARSGWKLVDPAVASFSPAAYQSFIRGSKGEFGVAKEMYVKTRSGWISDRSACYLASAKPVIVQDTGLVDEIPFGKGVWTYASAEEARIAVAAVAADYERQASLAREVACRFFDSQRVLSDLMATLSS